MGGPDPRSDENRPWSDWSYLLFSGFFCGFPGLSAVSGQCITGYLCHSGAVSPKPEDGVTGERCPQGHYCPEGLAAAPRPCPLGYYSNTTRNTQLSDCLPCPAGWCWSNTFYLKYKPLFFILWRNIFWWIFDWYTAHAVSSGRKSYFNSIWIAIYIWLA